MPCLAALPAPHAFLPAMTVPASRPDLTPLLRFPPLLQLSIRDGLEITKLFPAENKPEYREQLKADGRVSLGCLWGWSLCYRSPENQVSPSETS